MHWGYLEVRNSLANFFSACPILAISPRVHLCNKFWFDLATFTALAKMTITLIKMDGFWILKILLAARRWDYYIRPKNSIFLPF